MRLRFGRLLHAFNIEFGEPTPPADLFAERAAALIDSGEVVVLFAGGRPDGFAELRFRPSLYTEPSMPTWRSSTSSPSSAVTALDERCSRPRWNMHESAAPRTSISAEDDVAARALYESAGFTNREGGPDGPRMLYYERDL